MHATPDTAPPRLPTGALRRPSTRAAWAEVRAVADLLRMLPALRGQRPDPRLAGAAPVMVLPGYGGNDLSTWPLRAFLRRRGLAVEGWGLGLNRGGLDLPHTLDDISPGWGMADRDRARERGPYAGDGGVAYLSDRVGERVAARARALGRPLALVGWSLGGTIAREVARDHPDAVERVVTLGSPVIGGPKYTTVGPALAARGLDLDWIEAQVARRDARPIGQPVTAIHSRSDGVVGWGATIDAVSPRARHVEVDVAHFGLGFNPGVWAHVLDALAAPLDPPPG